MGRMTAEEAKEIFQGLLDIVVASYRDKDFEAFASVVQLPHHITTSYETITIRTPDQLASVFNAVCSLIHATENMDVKGICTKASARGRDRIDGEYSTIVPDDHPILAPVIESKTVLMWMGGKWVACVSHYAFGKDDVTAIALREAVKE